MNSISKLSACKELLLADLADHILSINYREIIRELKIIFKGGFYVFLRYNDFGEYGYQIMFSDKKSDYERFDNFDENWPVETSPHHFHKLNPREVVDSPMIGDPNHDMKILAEYLIKVFDLN